MNHEVIPPFGICLFVSNTACKIGLGKSIMFSQHFTIFEVILLIMRFLYVSLRNVQLLENVFTPGICCKKDICSFLTGFFLLTFR